jgi:hypothetical protein
VGDVGSVGVITWRHRVWVRRRPPSGLAVRRWKIQYSGLSSDRIVCCIRALYLTRPVTHPFELAESLVVNTHVAWSRRFVPRRPRHPSRDCRTTFSRPESVPVVLSAQRATTTCMPSRKAVGAAPLMTGIVLASQSTQGSSRADSRCGRFSRLSAAVPQSSSVSGSHSDGTHPNETPRNRPMSTEDTKNGYHKSNHG